jgi:hypothetical protein
MSDQRVIMDHLAEHLSQKTYVEGLVMPGAPTPIAQICRGCQVNFELRWLPDRNNTSDTAH